MRHRQKEVKKLLITIIRAKQARKGTKTGSLVMITIIIKLVYTYIKDNNDYH